MTRVFVLGAPDPEMERIEELLTWRRERFEHALIEGRRVTPQNAYDAPAPLHEPATTYLVECCAEGSWTCTRIDHHRPGDPGYGVRPEEYLRGSSLGQVLAVLEMEPTTEDRLIAAADHCLRAAYAGRCPGVDPDELADWRARSRAAFQRRRPEELLADVERAARVIADAPTLELGGELVADLRGLPTGTVPEAPEASARAGVPVLYRLARRDEVTVGLLGSEGPAVAAFLGGWAAELGLVGLYGDAARGYAGGRLP